MKRIFVKDGFVERVELDPKGETPSNAYDVPDPTNVFAGFTDNGDGTFTAPETPLDELKARYLENVKQEHAHMLELFTENQTVAERDTWPIKFPAAKDYDRLSKITERTEEQEEQFIDERDYLAGCLGDDDLADVIAAGLEPARVMADRIIARAKINKDLTKRAENVKQTANRVISSATSPEDLAAKIADSKVKEAQAIADFKAMLDAL